MAPGFTSKYDLALVEAARGGDRDAILQLLAAAQPDIRRYARLNCSRSEDAEDATQDVLWLLYRRVGTLRAIGSLSAWLLELVRRHCLGMLRRGAGRVAARSTELDAALDDPAIAQRLAQRPTDDLRIDVCRAIESLPEHYREVILLRDVQEMTVDEIAQALTLTREAVKGRLHRARGLLREYLAS